MPADLTRAVPKSAKFGDHGHRPWLAGDPPRSQVLSNEGVPRENFCATDGAVTLFPADRADIFTPSEAEDSTHGGAPVGVLRRPVRHQPAAPVVLAADPRLLSAGRWDRVRIQPVATDEPLVAEAQRHLGRPYRWGSSDPNRGLDCSGFTYAVYRRAGRPVPLAWFRNDKIDPRRQPQRLERDGMRRVKRPLPGDVVVFGRQHIGIYMGNLQGHPLYISANHGGQRRPGRVDIMPVSSVGIRPVYYRYAPEKTRETRPGVRR